MSSDASLDALYSLTFEDWDEIKRVIVSEYGIDATPLVGIKVPISNDTCIDLSKNQRTPVKPYVYHEIIVSAGKINRHEWFAKFYDYGQYPIRIVHVENGDSHLEKLGAVNPSTGQRLLPPSHLFV